jgi:hypothetical protein
VAAFVNIRRALKPKGRMCFICWRPMIENPWMLLPVQAASQHIEVPVPPDPSAPGPFAFGDAERLRGILTSAGYTEVQIDKHDEKLPVGGASDLDEAVNFAFELGPISALLADKGDELRQTVRASIRKALEPLLTPEGVMVDWAAWLVSARNP